MKYHLNKRMNPLRSIGLDLLSALVIFILLFFFTIILGAVLFVFALVGKGFALIGSLFFLLVIPLMVIGILLLNNKTVNMIRKKDNKIIHRIKPLFFSSYCITKGQRRSFIITKFASLGVIVLFFIFNTIITAIFLFYSNICCFFLPFAYPLVMLSIMLPAVGWVMFAHAFDMYKPEPRTIIIIGILWGMFSTFPSLFINTYNSTWMPQIGLDTAIFSAPIFEELFKMIGFVIVFSKIRDETDGVLYGATFGAGFALLENFLYSTDFILGTEIGPAIGFTLILIFRSFFNILIHMAGPVLIGFFIGFIRVKQRSSIDTGHLGTGGYSLFIVLLMFIGFVFAVLNHALWNFLVGSEGFIVLLLIVQGSFNFLFYIAMVIIGFAISTFRRNDIRKKHQKRINEQACR